VSTEVCRPFVSNAKLGCYVAVAILLWTMPHAFPAM
jgi:hypothetical protein